MNSSSAWPNVRRKLREQIIAKDRAHAKLQEAQKRIIEVSRLSGMAEVATGVTHNVGNVLNSINVGARNSGGPPGGFPVDSVATTGPCCSNTKIPLATS